MNPFSCYCRLPCASKQILAKMFVSAASRLAPVARTLVSTKHNCITPYSCDKIIESFLEYFINSIAILCYIILSRVLCVYVSETHYIMRKILF